MNASFLSLPHFRSDEVAPSGNLKQPLGGALSCLCSGVGSWVQGSPQRSAAELLYLKEKAHTHMCSETAVLAPPLETWLDDRSLNLTKPDYPLPIWG